MRDIRWIMSNRVDWLDYVVFMAFAFNCWAFFLCSLLCLVCSSRHGSHAHALTRPFLKYFSSDTTCHPLSHPKPLKISEPEKIYGLIFAGLARAATIDFPLCINCRFELEPPIPILGGEFRFSMLNKKNTKCNLNAKMRAHTQQFPGKRCRSESSGAV